MKKSTLLSVIIISILLNFVTNAAFPQEIVGAVSKDHRKLFPKRTIKKYLPFQPRRILFTGSEISPEMMTVTIGLEIPIRKATSFETNFGYGTSGTYHYSEDFGSGESSLSKKSLNLFVSSGLKFYFMDLNRRSNWFVSSVAFYSKAKYKSSHLVVEKWKYRQAVSLLGYELFSARWYPEDSHLNTYEIEVTNIGLELCGGFQKIFLNRIPFEIRSGFVIRQNNERLTGYESGLASPNKDDYPSHDYSGIVPTLTFKIGYLLYKN